jgi:hypothetical protein
MPGGDTSYPATGGAGTTTQCVRPTRRVTPIANTTNHRLRPFIVSSPPRPCVSDGGHATWHGQAHGGTPIHQPLLDISSICYATRSAPCSADARSGQGRASRSGWAFQQRAGRSFESGVEAGSVHILQCTPLHRGSSASSRREESGNGLKARKGLGHDVRGPLHCEEGRGIERGLSSVLLSSRSFSEVPEAWAATVCCPDTMGALPVP